MKRAIILLLDSLGIGSSADADRYGDQGANTLGHIIDYCQKADSTEKRTQTGPLIIPNLTQRGLLAALNLSRGNPIDIPPSNGLYGYGIEMSHGKDTPSGHWEICGVPALFDWGYFNPSYPSFPEWLVNTLIKEGGITGILGNCHASGTEIIKQWGEKHMQTHHPIVYTSADSVFQIAAHEETFGLDRLYELCQIARRLVDKLNIGRVIARPFLGQPGNFYRTGNRRDYTQPPSGLTLLDKLQDTGGEVIAIGKTADIFAHQGISQNIKAVGNHEIFSETLKALEHTDRSTIIFSNFVDFDSSYGHRRDADGYAAALEAFDQRLPELDAVLTHEDLVVITADHGCDPTWPGSDHTREHIPILVYGPSLTETRSIGARRTFADIGQSLAAYFDLPPFKYGTSFFN